uniref:Reverse transcriptase Ty1/copia-type domain-containing protein n=1 Tax=Cajanus cajan TaxID=3821 RepID=A0A151SXI8_CAJCA|nr:hypothetical protein KK1_014909 [Cajanus cajan]
MDDEIHAIEKNETWELTKLPTYISPIGMKLVYKTKYNSNGEVDRFKARLIAKGYQQKLDIDYFEIFAHVAFEMKNLGLMSHFIGIEVVQQDDEIFISKKNM